MKNAVLASVAALLCAAPSFAHEDKGCEAFTWDLSREFAAMRTPGINLPAADTIAHAGALTLGKHYTATLLPQADVTFAKAPARPPRADKPMAGLFTFTVPTTGRYRIGLTTSHWIDVLDGDMVIDSLSHQGQSQCELLHKVVEFELPAGKPLTLQISGQDAATVDFIVSAA